jgi:hypothetical protein
MREMDKGREIIWEIGKKEELGSQKNMHFMLCCEKYKFEEELKGIAIGIHAISVSESGNVSLCWVKIV